jgi:hypothetical protein
MEDYEKKQANQKAPGGGWSLTVQKCEPDS